MSRESSLPVESDLLGRRSLKEKVEAAVCAYLKEVNRIGITPWGDTFSNNSIKEITDNLELFDQAHIRKLNVKPCDCKCSPFCGYSIAWDEVVKKFRKDTLECFDGLRLDCMKHERSSHQDGYDKDCRIEHGEASWYFSFVGYR
ncbi:hypothetical protein N7465_010866 [Penicillium sp. CMV-2018d]|nr:hypothetical protein N7465_010866 [Penicillium sp. CMV-2018d]